MDPASEGDLDGEWQWAKHQLGRQLCALESALRCAICSDFLRNPHSLLCGHSFCSECIRRHLDHSCNATTSGICPTCRDAAAPSQLRVSRDLMEVIQIFQTLRSELLFVVNKSGRENPFIDPAVVEPSVSTPSESSSVKRDLTEVRRLPPRLFHIETKEKVRKALEKLTENCSVKIRLDGDKETLVKRYTEFVHLNNAQLSAKAPLSLNEIVNELHRREKALEINNSVFKRAHSVVEKIKLGQVSCLLVHCPRGSSIVRRPRRSRLVFLPSLR
jgi:hypothetical protein